MSNKAFIKLIFAAIFFIAPFPIFFDLSSFSIFLFRPESLQELFSVKPDFPVPVTLFCVTIYFFVSFCCLFFQNRNVQPLFCLINKKLITFYILLALILIAIFKSLGVNFSSILQIVIPFLFLAIFIIPIDRDIFSVITKSYCTGIFVLVCLHFISILVNNDFSVSGIDRYMNFSTFFGFTIYQSLVSYNAILSLFLIFLLWYRKKQATTIFGSSFLFLVFLLTLFIGFSGQARMFFLDATIALILFLWINFKVLLKRKVAVSFLIFFPLLAGSIVFLMSNYTGRVLRIGASDRFLLLTRAINELYSNPIEYFFWGTGQIHSYAHNLLLNWMLGFGLFFTLSYFFFFCLAFLGIIFGRNKIVSFIRFKDNNLIFIFCTLLVLVTNSTFNSALTQPLFFSNFIIMLIVFVAHQQIILSVTQRELTSCSKICSDPGLGRLKRPPTVDRFLAPDFSDSHKTAHRMRKPSIP